MNESINIFHQMHDFFEHFEKIFAQGINSIDDLVDIIDSATMEFNKYLTCVHPRFIPILTFALAVALLFKFLRLDGIH